MSDIFGLKKQNLEYQALKTDLDNLNGKVDGIRTVVNGIEKLLSDLGFSQ